ncbi:uncharacterized protein LOC123681943 isoform X1 [Harmonia axyridis]|uniref:uncharacterized protein LOC123681943 isoform X1 n=1 Tax=Harmonia axyridis TaxID=115357 RepID=UPI001E27866B|nr:uncharacterized protein LOC123681943 isoform X1 [Harmonia axyridis]
MRYMYKVFFCCALLAAVQEVAQADKEDKSDETAELHQDSPEVAEGPPDSHEAMNNREINPITKTRQKRSYEFLMGLINNNSRYQVTKQEQAVNPAEKQAETTNDLGAGELLLELLVKITANPDQWSRVHKLLRQIDQDILTSKKLIEDYQNNTRKIQTILEGVENPPHQEQTTTTPPPMVEKSKKKYKQDEINKEVAMISDNGQPDINTGLFMNTIISTTSTKEWPTFENEESKVTFVNNELSSNAPTDRIKQADSESSTTKAYPKYFSYHRVTGKPIFINRNPKAYVAVSVVAPKSPEVHSDEDLELEDELRQLKPWTHSQNLKNMESIRSRWIIDTSKEDKNAEV